jgi:FtsP/CotA-like multicopper oxidase with cupredoxin domain
VAFITALSLDLVAAWLVVAVVVRAALRPADARLLLFGAAALIVGRAAVDVALAQRGTVFALRYLTIDLPLAAVAVGVALVVVLRGRARPRVLWAAAGLCALSAIGPLLVTGPIATVALSVLAIAGPWMAAEGARRRIAGGLVALTVVTGTGSIAQSWWQSRVPDRYDLGEFAAMDTGGAAVTASRAVSVTELTGPEGEPDVRVSLTAAPLTVTRNGRREKAVAFNGTIPGPAIRAEVGDLVEVHLCNRGDVDGVSIHWHGYPVPNAEDGVAGVTQDAIADGACHDYRFRATMPGTYWYHAHQASSVQVDRGLYGALVIAPEPVGQDFTVLDHAWRPPGGYLAGARWEARTNTELSTVPPGTAVRLRLVNTDRFVHQYRLTGAGFRVIAVDGSPIPGAGTVDGELSLAAGGRYDLAFTMPPGGVRLDGLGEGASIVLAAPLGAGPAEPAKGGKALDLLHYGSGTSAEADQVRAEPTRRFELVMDQKLAFSGGRIAYAWAVNGLTYPRMPMMMVDSGDLVRVRLVNRTTANHPMHLHGHRVLVLSRNGRAATGAPWWSDTLNVAPGDDYVVAFRADNPGIWMNHCHDLRHAADGFVLHLNYTGVSTPFRIGSHTANHPE